MISILLLVLYSNFVALVSHSLSKRMALLENPASKQSPIANNVHQIYSRATLANLATGSL